MIHLVEDSKPASAKLAMIHGIMDRQILTAIDMFDFSGFGFGSRFWSHRHMFRLSVHISDGARL